MDDQSPTGRFKDWIAATLTLTFDFSIVGLLGWMKGPAVGEAIIGCALGLAIIFAIGPSNLTRLGNGVQLVPWLPPTVGPLPAVTPEQPLEPDPDPALVPRSFRVEWQVSRVLMLMLFSPVLPMIPIRKLLDRIA